MNFGDATSAVYGYDGVGNRASVLRSNGVTTQYSYDNQNRLTMMQQVAGASSANPRVLSRFDYVVRADGKRSGVREVVGNPAAANANNVAATTRSISYAFDGAGRLTQEKREERETLLDNTTREKTLLSGYGYDEVGNRTQRTVNSYTGLGANAVLASTRSTRYDYNARDFLTAESTTAGTATDTTAYSYDANGSQVSVTRGAVTTPYSYDFEGKLVGVGADNASTRARYRYDGEGNRVQSISVSGGVAKTTNYLNDTNTAYVQVLEERDENGVLQARYDYGDGDLQKLTRRKASDGTLQSRWFLNDGLDSTRQLTDDAGIITDTWAYEAFGTASTRAGETQNSRLFNGQQQDETGLYFLRARYYNSGNGRFLSEDPIVGSSDDPVSLHRYLYAGVDPVNHTDPSGKDFSLSGALASIGVNTALTAQVFSVSMNVLSVVGTAGSAYNIFSDYTAAGTVNPWDAASLAADLVLPRIGGLLLKRLHTPIGAAIGRLGGRIGVNVAAGIGRWGGKIASVEHLAEIETELAGLGVTLVRNADDFLEAKGAAGYIEVSRSGVGKIWIRSDATLYEVLHEVAHAIHWKSVGHEAFRAAGTVGREERVFEEILKNQSVFGFTAEEIMHAAEYIGKVHLDEGVGLVQIL